MAVVNNIPALPHAKLIKTLAAQNSIFAANVAMKNDTSKTIFPAYKVKTYGGIPVAFIGLTLEATQVLFSGGY
jgi:2',3'-cyclic-nucleotide 2'-phosphodiesterase (5'-nucleotidase family)